MRAPRFVGELDVRAFGTDEWQLLSPLTYWTAILTNPLQIIAPIGFISDLASIPRLVQSIVPKVGKHRKPAVIHDLLYYMRGELPSGLKLTRKQCDLIFLEAMKLAGVRFTRRQVMYWAVRSGGWVFWNKPKEQTQ